MQDRVVLCYLADRRSCQGIIETIPHSNGLAFTLENTDELRLLGDTVQIFEENGESFLI